MVKQTSFIILALIFTFTTYSSACAQTMVRSDLEMGGNYAKSAILDLTKDTELRVVVKNESESGSWLRYSVDIKKPFIIPGMPPIDLLETVKDDFVAVGKDTSFTLKVTPGKYVISLHSDEGNCKGSGTISYPPSDHHSDEEVPVENENENE